MLVSVKPDEREKRFVCHVLDNGNRERVESLMITFLYACERQARRKRKKVRLPRA